MRPESSRRFWSFQAGSMLPNRPGAGIASYHPIPKPSPSVASAPSFERRLWSINE